jgi:cobalt/nickel transport system permease protein
MFELLLSISDYKDRIIVKTDPRVKVILLLSLFGSILISSELIQLLVLLLGVCSLLWISQLPVVPIIRVMLKIYPIIFVISLIQLISQIGGDPLYLGKSLIRISSADWVKLLFFQLKSILILLSGLIFISSTPYPLLLKGLEKIHWPERFIALMLFIYRFIFILSYELHRIYLAFKSRYIKLSFRKRIRVYINMITIYFIRLFDRNEHLFRALISRGFEGKVYCGQSLAWSKIDTVILITGTCLLTFILLFV